MMSTIRGTYSSQIIESPSDGSAMLLEDSNKTGFLFGIELGIDNHKKGLIRTQKDVFQVSRKGL
jgi:hypothetical protein